MASTAVRYPARLARRQPVELPRLPAPSLHEAPALEVLGGAAIVERRRGAPASLGFIDAEVREGEQGAGQRERHLPHVVRPLPAQHLPGFFRLEPVAHGTPQGRLHAREDTGRGAVVGVADEPAQAAEVAGMSKVAHEGAPPHLDVCLLYTSDAADDLLCVDLGG